MIDDAKDIRKDDDDDDDDDYDDEDNGRGDSKNSKKVGAIRILIYSSHSSITLSNFISSVLPLFLQFYRI